MAKYYGSIGFATAEETSPGVWKDIIVERKYYGNVIKNVKRQEQSEHLNDNLNINNSISIIADAYANDNLFAIKYVTWMGAKWKIGSVEVQPPRLILSIGGLYNGNEAVTTA